MPSLVDLLVLSLLILATGVAVVLVMRDGWE